MLARVLSWLGKLVERMRRVELFAFELKFSFHPSSTLQYWLQWSLQVLKKMFELKWLSSIISTSYSWRIRFFVFSLRVSDPVRP